MKSEISYKIQVLSQASSQDLKDQVILLSETKNFLQSLKKKFLEMDPLASNTKEDSREFSLNYINSSNKNLIKKDSASFNNLFSQYNKTKRSLNNEKSPRFAENLELEIDNLKRNLMNKIDEAIIESPKRSFSENRSNSQEIKDLINEKESLERVRGSALKTKENKDPNIRKKSENSSDELQRKDDKIHALKQTYIFSKNFEFFLKVSNS